MRSFRSIFLLGRCSSGPFDERSIELLEGRYGSRSSKIGLPLFEAVGQWKLSHFIVFFAILTNVKQSFIIEDHWELRKRDFGNMKCFCKQISKNVFFYCSESFVYHAACVNSTLRYMSSKSTSVVFFEARVKFEANVDSDWFFSAGRLSFRLSFNENTSMHYTPSEYKWNQVIYFSVVLNQNTKNISLAWSGETQDILYYV